MEQTLEIICNGKKELVDVSIPDENLDKEGILTLDFKIKEGYFRGGHYNFFSSLEKKDREQMCYDGWDLTFEIMNRKNMAYWMKFKGSRIDKGVSMLPAEKVDINIKKAVTYFTSLSDVLVNQSNLDPSLKNILNEAYKIELKGIEDFHKILSEAKKRGMIFNEFIKHQQDLGRYVPI